MQTTGRFCHPRGIVSCLNRQSQLGPARQTFEELMMRFTVNCVIGILLGDYFFTGYSCLFVHVSGYVEGHTHTDTKRFPCQAHITSNN